MTLLPIALKALLLIGVAGLASQALRRSAAAARHRLWLATLTALLLLPLTPLLPRTLTVGLPAAPELLTRALPPLPQTVWVTAPAGGALAALWGLGTLVLLLRLAVAVTAAARGSTRARLVVDPTRLAEVAAIERELGLRPRSLLRSGPIGVVPYTFGIAPPQLVLPADADLWPTEARRAVLLHELAHVGRGDWLWQLLAALVTALYWPLPPVWAVARRLRLEGERSCDEAVLRAGVPASIYAELLLAFARRRRRPAVAALVRRSQLGLRVVSLLASARPSSGRGGWPLALLALAALTLFGLRSQPSAPLPAVAPPTEPLALIGPEAGGSGALTLPCDAIGLTPSERCRLLVLPQIGGDGGVTVRVRVLEGAGTAIPSAPEFEAALAEIEAELLRRRALAAPEPHLPSWADEQEYGL